MIIYTPTEQLTFSAFRSSFSTSLDPGNKWFKLVKIIPWDALVAVY